MKVLVRRVTTEDVLVDADYGDDQAVLEAAAATSAEIHASKVDVIVVGPAEPLLELDQPAYVVDNDGAWHPSEMSAADLERCTPAERAAYDKWAKGAKR